MKDNLIKAWPQRPYILASFLTIAGFIFYLTIESQVPENNQLRFALSTLVVSVSILFAFTLERLRWVQVLVFSLAVGCVLSFVAYSTAFDSNGRFDPNFDFLSGLFAVGIALPLFQTIHKHGRVTLPYEDLHTNAWNDVVCWCASWIFVGLSFTLANLLSSLFELVGIDLLKDLLREMWFIFPFIGASFGAALGVLKESNRIVSSLKSLVMTILSILAPVLCISLIVFLIALPFTGLESLWNATRGTTPILLSCAAGAIILINAIIRNTHDEESQNSIMRYSAKGLSICVLPLAVIAWISMIQRIDQYGFSPDRIWGMVTVFVAVIYGAAYLWSLIRDHKNWTSNLRTNNTRLAIFLCLFTLFLALPIVNFASISVNSQLARINDGRTSIDKIDFTAFAFDFGEKGREALRVMQESDDSTIANRANIALLADQRWDLKRQINESNSKLIIQSKLTIFPKKVEIPKDLESLINKNQGCLGEYCLLVWEEGATNAQLITSRCNRYGSFAHKDIASNGQGYKHCPPAVKYFHKVNSGWKHMSYGSYARSSKGEEEKDKQTILNAIKNGGIEIRTVERKQIFVGGKPVSKPY